MQLAQKTTLHYKRAVLPGPHAAPNHVRTLPLCRSDKMHVPSEGFGGLSPERKAANALRTLFTFVAARVVLAQLEGSGRGALGSYNAEAYQVLVDSLQLDPIKDGDQWIASLMRKNNSLALRVMEVRQTYCEQDFEWDQLQKLAVNDTKSANTKLMRSFATASLLAQLTEPAASAECLTKAVEGTSSSTQDTVLPQAGDQASGSEPDATAGGSADTSIKQ